MTLLTASLCGCGRRSGLRDAYNPDEPRDPKGKWTAGSAESFEGSEVIAFKPEQVRIIHTDAKPLVQDTASRRDPTGTLRIRAAFRRDMDARWQKIAKLATEALGAHDILQLRGPTAQSIAATAHHVPISGGKPIEEFRRWLAEAQRQIVLGPDGKWMQRYVGEAADLARDRASQLLGSRTASHDAPDHTLSQLAAAELQGIADAVTQRASRALAQGLLARWRPNKIARTIAQVVRKVGRYRGRLLVATVIVRAHASSTLQAFREAGVKRVGTVPERLKVARGPHGHHLTKDAGPPDEARDPKGKWTAGASGKMVEVYHGSLGGSYGPEEKHYGTLEAATKRVNDLMELPPESRPELTPRNPVPVIGRYEIKLGKVFEMKDPGEWWPGEMAHQFREQGVMTPKVYEDLERKEFDFDPYEYIRSQGYDTISYSNTFEGADKSYIPLRASNVRQLEVKRYQKDSSLLIADKDSPWQAPENEGEETALPSFPFFVPKLEPEAQEEVETGEERVAQLGRVDVLTAGDDQVCQLCEDISDDGPYDINDAEGLIPAHPNCRCSFVPADDERFAHENQ